MGSYLSSPDKKVYVSDGQGKGFIYATASCRGWRRDQEDAEECIPYFDDDGTLFILCDGHGGAEVAKYTVEHLPNFLKNHPLYKKGDYEAALKSAFIDFDAHLRTEEVSKELNRLAFEVTDEEKEGTKQSSDIGESSSSKEEPSTSSGAGGSSSSCPQSSSSPSSSKPGPSNGIEEEDTDPRVLREEALLPLENILKNYCNRGSDDEDAEDEDGNEDLADEDVPETSEHSARKELEKDLDEDDDDEDEEDDDYEDEVEDEDHDDDNDDDDEEDKDDDDEDDENDDDDDDEDDEDDDDDDDEDDEDDDDDDEDDVDVKDDQAWLWKSLLKVGSKKQLPADAMKRAHAAGMDSGCTVVVALVKDGMLHVASSGDSRCIVVMRQGRHKPMSFDHKPENKTELARIEKAGGRVVEGRVNGGLNLSRALGDFTYKAPNLPAEEQMITACPDIISCKLDTSQIEYIFLACDGIWNSMRNAQVAEFIRNRAPATKQDLIDTCLDLFRKCIADETSGDGTGCDNMTCIIARYDKEITEPNNDLKTENDEEEKKDSAEKKEVSEKEETEAIDKKEQADDDKKETTSKEVTVKDVKTEEVAEEDDEAKQSQKRSNSDSEESSSQLSKKRRCLSL